MPEVVIEVTGLVANIIFAADNRNVMFGGKHVDLLLIDRLF